MKHTTFIISVITILIFSSIVHVSDARGECSNEYPWIFSRTSSDYSYDAQTKIITGKIIYKKDANIPDMFPARIEFYNLFYQGEVVHLVDRDKINIGDEIEEVSNGYEKRNFYYNIGSLPVRAVFAAFYIYSNAGSGCDGTLKIRLRDDLESEYPRCVGNLEYDPEDMMCHCPDRENMTIQDGWCVCNEGFYKDDNVCVENPCPLNSKKVDDECICNDGYIKGTNGLCLRLEVNFNLGTVCKAPKILDDKGNCVTVTECSEDEYYDSGIGECLSRSKLILEDSENSSGCSISPNSMNSFGSVIFILASFVVGLRRRKI